MTERRYRQLSTRGPVILFVVVLVLSITLAVLWNFTLVNDYHQLRELTQKASFHWPFMILGSVLFLAIIVLSSILGAQLIGHVRWRQRQSNLIASVSHELNSPLSSIKLFAQTLRKPDMSVADRLDFVEKILFDVERLRRLISNILRAAEVDTSGDELTVQTHAVDLHEYLAGYLHDAARLHRENHLEIELTGDEDCWVRLDPLMFRQVLDNLIDNAVRYRGEGAPRVELRLARLAAGVELRVTDNGLGVAAQELPRLFERFYQVENNRARGKKGAGIGLFVVRSIVQAHDGQIEAVSAGPGHGMEMRIHLPAASSPAASPPSRIQAPSLEEEAA